MGIVTLVGRLLVAWLFLASAAGNIVRAGRVAAHARARNVPRARATTLAAGYAMLVIGLAIAVGLWLDVALMAAAALLIGIAVVMHPFWTVAGLDREQMHVRFWTYLALAGAVLVWMAYVIDTESVPYGLTGPLF